MIQMCDESFIVALDWDFEDSGRGGKGEEIQKDELIVSHSVHSEYRYPQLESDNVNGLMIFIGE